MTTLICYARVSKTDGSQVHDLQRDALVAAGVDPEQIYEDMASGRIDNRSGLDACLKALRRDDIFVIWKLDRFGRDLRHLVNTVGDLTKRGIGLKGLASARARGRHGGRPFKMMPAKLRLARQTLYRHVTPTGEIRLDGEKLLGRACRRA